MITVTKVNALHSSFENSRLQISTSFHQCTSFCFSQHNREIVKTFIPSLPTLIIKLPKLAVINWKIYNRKHKHKCKNGSNLYIKQHKQTVQVTQHLQQTVNQNFYMSQHQIFIKHKQEINNNNGSSQHEFLSLDAFKFL